MLVIAHRGDSVNAPENTLSAAISAINCGADGIEFDIHASADGNYVVCHDDTIDRTSNGKGRIETLEYKKMLEYDFGSWFGEKFKGERMPFLAEFLQAVYSMKIINMEIKAFRAKSSEKTYSLLYEIVDDFKFYDRFIISSFDAEALKIMRGFDSRLKTAFLCGSSRPGSYIWSGGAAAAGETMIGLARELGCAAIHPHFNLINEKFMKEAKSAGLAVNAWTVDSEREILRCAELGCGAVITNNPSFALAVLKKK